MGPGNSVLLKSRVKQAARERSAKRNPALRFFKSNPRAAVVCPVVGRTSRSAWGLQAPPVSTRKRRPAFRLVEQGRRKTRH
jgi:hypothetical protein